MNKWVKWSKTHVMAELLLVPRVTQQTIETLKAEFHTIAANFRSERQDACNDLLQKLQTVQTDGDAKLAAALENLMEDLNALTKQGAAIPVPPVLVILRDNFDRALGDVFGGIASRTVEPLQDADGDGDDDSGSRELEEQKQG